MKKQDFLVILTVLLVLAPFFAFDAVYDTYLKWNNSNPYLLAFVKFAILGTFGEMLASRIRTGKYYDTEFGLCPKMIVWGLLGMWIALAMKVFAAGVPAVMEKLFAANGLVDAMQGEFSVMKLAGAFCISVIMNTSFAPVFMTIHKMCDMHIAQYHGSVKCLAKPVRMADLLSRTNWNTQWNFVFKKTIPLFWIPAHTITFILPMAFQVLFAAFLGVVLGLILAIAAKK
ncbi:MAG: hypothetical protein J5701_03050 [Bacteroidales bacterium]|nr:hypothetical protein [Bacteroidales bacterium]